MKTTSTERMRKWRSLNRERNLEHSRKWQATRKQKAIAGDPRFIHSDEKYYGFIKSRYGITKEYYLHLLEKQNGVCAICSKVNVHKNKHGSLNKRLVVDHCHSTGLVRGLLCNRCNIALGGFNDDPTLLKSAILYMDEFLKSH